MDRSKLDAETLNENTLKTPDLDDYQLEADKKQVESNEGIEETKQDEQAVEAEVKSTLNEVIETVDGRGQLLKQLASGMDIMSYYLFFISEEAVELGRDF
ncbi:putative polyferredoxin-like protein [Trichinella spiralis]|uniref:Polyferredoxin-like protein n=1 Tax=Trichinella spiralis TaxID=6334 RepID=A0ABR3KR87_TRISP